MSLRQLVPTFRSSGLCWLFGCFTQVISCVVDLSRVQTCACHSIENKPLSSKTDRTSLRNRVEPGMRHAAQSLRFTDTEFYFSIKEIGSFEQFCQIIESDTAKEEKSHSHF